MLFCAVAGLTVPAPRMTAILAHQGGWDEVVLVILPIVILVLLLRAARRRAEGETSDDDKGRPSTKGDAGGNK